MEVVFTTREPFRVVSSGLLTASTNGELLVGAGYDIGDSLTTDYIYFPNNTTDAIWSYFVVQKIRAKIITEQEPFDIPSFRLIFTTRVDLSLVKGQQIAPTPGIKVDEVLGWVNFGKTAWNDVFSGIKDKEIEKQIILPIILGRDFYSFAVVTEGGSFTSGTQVLFEIFGRLA